MWNPDYIGLSAQWRKLSRHIAPLLSLKILGEHTEVKRPVGHRSVLFRYGSENSWFEFLEAKEMAACTWDLPDGRQAMCLEAGTQRSRGIRWLAGALEAGGGRAPGGGGGTEVTSFGLGACPWSMTPTTLFANG